MTVPNLRRLIQAQSTLLGPGLYDGLATSIAAAGRRARGLDHASYPFLRPQLTRVELREHLITNGLPSGWRVTGDARMMGQLFLQNPKLQLQLRFLKERRRRYPGGVPTAGHNQARRRYWQAPLFDLDGSEQSAAQLNQLLLLWDYAASQDAAAISDTNGDGATVGSDDRTHDTDDVNNDQSAFSLRIVHTVEPGVYGRAVRCDLNLLVKAGGKIFEDLEFAGSPEEENFFEVQIDKEENES